MREDACRRLERRLSPEAELRDHLDRTFFHSVNLLFHGCGHAVRAADTPALVAALAWCSVVRDFHDDCAKGLFNVPCEIVDDLAADENPASLPGVEEWLERQRALGPGLLAACERERERVARSDPAAARLIGLFARSMHKYRGAGGSTGGGPTQPATGTRGG
jgi:hypothetical protein